MGILVIVQVVIVEELESEERLADLYSLASTLLPCDLRLNNACRAHYVYYLGPELNYSAVVNAYVTFRGGGNGHLLYIGHVVFRNEFLLPHIISTFGWF